MDIRFKYQIKVCYLIYVYSVYNVQVQENNYKYLIHYGLWTMIHNSSVSILLQKNIQVLQGQNKI